MCSTYKGFSTTIGVPTNMSLLYRVSRDDLLLRSCLTGKAEDVVIGKHHGSLELRFSANATVSHFATTHRSLLRMSA